ncbi:MAG: diphthamide synthesis protein [Nanoarchaeota archaeon]|nr:diphthamide synthesis protein [Nanoarchaeota archaeon]
MKLFFIPAKSQHPLTPILKKIKIPEKKIGLVASVQFLHRLPELQKHIKGSVICGQILGCNFSIIDKAGPVDAYLYLGSAHFHPIGLARHVKQPVYIANPITQEFNKLDEQEVKKYEQQQRGKLLKFLNAKHVGIIVSIKPHQGNIQRALKFQEELKGKKESTIFLCDNLDINQLENFQSIDYWVNTACPRIEYPQIINLIDAVKALKQ